MASSWSASLNGGLGAELQLGPGAVGGHGVKLKAFLYIIIQKSAQKVLNENLPPPHV